MSRFMELVHSKFRELTYNIDTQSITGSINKESFHS